MKSESAKKTNSEPSKTATPKIARSRTVKNAKDSAKPSEAKQSEEASTTPLKILFVASECAPLAKTGGLGDVVAGLSKALKRAGHDVRIVMPLYASIKRSHHPIQFVQSCGVHMGNGEENWVGIHEMLLDDLVPVWFIDYERYFGRDGIYDNGISEYEDNGFRFSLLSKAAMQACKDRGFIPDVMHLHDWPTSPTAALLKTWDRICSPLSNTATVLTIHNIGYQGVYHPSAFPYLGIGQEYFRADCFEDHGKLNMLKGGVHFADAITTVSPTHASELITPEGGKGLAPFLSRRQRDLFGILNGVDYDHWNPETDNLIPATYSAKNLKGKAKCKQALQERFGLEVNPKVPIFGIVSRLVHQKGFSLLEECLSGALENMIIQCVILGSGEGKIEEFVHWITRCRPGQVGSYIGFSNELSHWIEAGSDFFMMPSLYEPCGLNQIYSMRYGTLPVVRNTGGLADTVEPYNEELGIGTGFMFDHPNSHSLYNAIGQATATWYDRPKHIDQMRQLAMAKSFAWTESAQEYVEVYEHAIRNRRSASH